MYVLLPNFESGGVYFTSLFSWTIRALYLFQLSIIGIVGLKKAAVPSILLIPLLFVTAAFHSYCESFMQEKAAHLPAFEAKKNDDFDIGKDSYLQPALGPVMQPDFLAASIEEQSIVLGRRESGFINAVSL